MYRGIRVHTYALSISLIQPSEEGLLSLSFFPLTISAGLIKYTTFPYKPCLFYCSHSHTHTHTASQGINSGECGGIQRGIWISGWRILHHQYKRCGMHRSYTAPGGPHCYENELHFLLSIASATPVRYANPYNTAQQRNREIFSALPSRLMH